MSLQLFINGALVPLHYINFPAGETHVRIDTQCRSGSVQPGMMVSAVIRMVFNHNSDLINLALLVDAIRQRWNECRIVLQMPYIPYARQDRVTEPGEPVSIAVIARLINSLQFAYVEVIDPHSDVSAALIERVRVLGLTDVTASLLYEAARAVEGHALKNVSLVSPDAGANKKVLALAKKLGGIPMVRADKTRDTKTGQITGTVVYMNPPEDHAHDGDFIVVDDICDGGRTFIELAKELRKRTTGKIFLYVSHALMTKGVAPLLEHYDHIFTANRMCNEEHPKLTTIFRY